MNCHVSVKIMRNNLTCAPSHEHELELNDALLCGDAVAGVLP